MLTTKIRFASLLGLLVYGLGAAGCFWHRDDHHWDRDHHDHWDHHDDHP